MIAGVRPRTFLLLRNRARRAVRGMTPKPTTKNQTKGLGLIASYEKMLGAQVQLMLNSLNE